MHSLNHPDLARVIANDRVEAAHRRAIPGTNSHPPPVRSHAAYLTARLARRLDPTAARRAVV